MRVYFHITANDIQLSYHLNLTSQNDSLHYLKTQFELDKSNV